MPDEVPAGEDTWNILLVEDDENFRRELKEYLAGEKFASRGLSISDIPDLSDALKIIQGHKADLVILDIYRGAAARGGEQTGIEVLEAIKRSGFVPVVLYTALPEGAEGHKSSFVRLVGKEHGGLAKLKEEIEDLFRMKVPQLHRAIIDHLDQALCSYMWSFVQQHWEEFNSIIEKPEFLRLVVQRLAMTFARQGIEEMTAQVYGTPAPTVATDPEAVHPAEYYIKPPIGNDPLLGDIRLREHDGKKTHWVVLWPSCDMVTAGGRVPKVDHVLCGLATAASETPEVMEWLKAPSDTKRRKVEDLLKNKRDKSPDRYHFLPGAWDIPDLVVDFQALEHLSLTTVRGLSCLATLASPFAEALAVRFQRYIGRLGTPDLNLDFVVARLDAGKSG